MAKKMSCPLTGCKNFIVTRQEFRRKSTGMSIRENHHKKNHTIVKFPLPQRARTSISVSQSKSINYPQVRIIYFKKESEREIFIFENCVIVTKSVIML